MMHTETSETWKHLKYYIKTIYLKQKISWRGLQKTGKPTVMNVVIWKLRKTWGGEVLEEGSRDDWKERLLREERKLWVSVTITLFSTTQIERGILIPLLTLVTSVEFKGINRLQNIKLKCLHWNPLSSLHKELLSLVGFSVPLSKGSWCVYSFGPEEGSNLDRLGKARSFLWTSRLQWSWGFLSALSHCSIWHTARQTTWSWC